MIVDVHSHLGYDLVFEEDFNHKRLLDNMKANYIDISIVQPGTTFDREAVIDQHNAIAELAEKMPGKIYGLANPNPYLKPELYREEIQRCVEVLGFVGVKLHPLGHAINPNSSKGKLVFKTALDFGIPVMVHTGAGVPWALPSTLIPRIQEYSDLKIVLAHCGGALFSGEAALAAKQCSNVYLETSWLPSTTIYSFCKNIGADRIMFGSDNGENAASELIKYRTCGLSDEDLEWCLGKTAIKVFKISKYL